MEATTLMPVEVVLEKDSVTANVSGQGHGWIIDEPEVYGGGNLGPDPYSYLLSALGACTAITLRLYAKRKQWPLERIIVKLSHQKNHAENCERCEEDSAKLDQIEKQLILEGNLSPEQITRLHVIADKCPVQKTLVAGIAITSSVVSLP